MRGIRPESSSVKFGHTAIEYRILRSGRKITVSIAVDPAAGVVVTAPETATVQRLDQLVLQKATWIVEQLRRRQELQPVLPAREFVSGETVRYLGRQYRLKVESGQPDVWVLLRGAFLHVHVPTAAQARPALVSWYRYRTAHYLPRRIEFWAPRLKIRSPQLIVSEPAKRWGSASPGCIRVNWRIIQAPLILVDYVVLHELVHLVHKDHGPLFWAALGRAMPDYEDRKARLRVLGPRLVW